MSMTFETAATQARKAKRFWEAFALFEDVLVVAARAEQATQEAEGRKVSLDKEISALSETCGELHERQTELIASIEVLKPEADEYKAGLEVALQTFLRETEDEKNAAIEAVNKAVTDAGVEADEVKAKLAAEIATLKEKRAEAEADLETALAGVAGLQKQVEGLGQAEELD